MAGWRPPRNAPPSPSRRGWGCVAFARSYRRERSADCALRAVRAARWPPWPSWALAARARARWPWARGA
eukprot:9092437-Pyramimonas_sp.AAC.1